MNESNLLQSKRKTLQILSYAAIAVALIWLIVSTWEYHVSPLTGENADYKNEQLYNTMLLGAALAAAIMSTLVAAQFKITEPPFLVWLMFAIGWWAWAAAEASCIGMYVCCYYVDWPDITILDIFYTIGYLFFILALFFQFRLIYGREKKIGLVYYFIIIALALLLTLGVTQLSLKAGLGEGRSWISLYQALFYPVGDLAIGLAALWLSLLFGRGTWGRPWWGLIGFAVADGINIFLWIGGDSLINSHFSNGEQIIVTIDLISTIVYMASYLFVAIAFLVNYSLIKYGPAPRRKRRVSGLNPTPLP
jgi:hypothetical protein